jgi:hypothetical protein
VETKHPVPQSTSAPVPTSTPTPVPPTPSPQVPASTPQPKVPTKFASQLAQLAEMGFKDTNLNTYLLEMYKGNVQTICRFLLEQGGN